MTKFILNRFHTKVTLALLASFVLVGLILVTIFQHLSQGFQNEIEQKLHIDLAKHIVHDNRIFNQGSIDQAALKQAFNAMMILGPSFEFYLLDKDGNIITHAAKANKVKRQQVSLAPIKRYLAGESLPLRGDDPRNLDRQKIFSVAEVKDNGKLTGYLYIIIGSEIYDGLVDHLSNSYMMEMTLWSLLATLALGLLIALSLFAFFSRPLRRLTKDMQAFRYEGFEGDMPDLNHWCADSNDEIHQLGSSFRNMAIALQQQYQKVKTTDELRRELISYVSHDLRTPLASLVGYLETWQIKQGKITEQESQQLIDVAAKNGQRISVLVEQLLELAHLDSDEVPIKKEPVAVAELAQDVLQKLKLDAEKKLIALDVNPKDPSIMALADIEKLERVFTNLVDNAIRHSRQGDQIQIALDRHDDFVTVEIRDSGVGIPEAELGFIFDPHFRASNSVQGSHSNSGLGLAISKRILELHGSAIEVSSQLNKGTSFRFNLQQWQYA